MKKAVRFPRLPGKRTAFASKCDRYCFLALGGVAAGGLGEAAGGVAAGFGLAAGVAPGLAVAGADAPPACAASYSLMISVVISAEGSAHSTGVCWLLTSSTMAKPFWVEYLMMTSIIFCPRSCMILPSSC